MIFITIDGPDGAGKSTLAKALTERLNQSGKQAVFTTEPTHTPLGQLIRKKLITGESSTTLLPMFLTDRDVHVKAFIEPYLAEDIIVVCDRYKYSTICYQHLQGEDIDMLIERNADFRKPDIAFILYADVDILLNRIDNRNTQRDFFETREFLTKSVQLYKDMPTLFPDENIVLIDASPSANDILKEIELAINRCYPHIL